MTEAALDNVITFFIQETMAPARLAGEILLVHETLDQSKENRRAWVYNPGQRRVRRAPNVAFDNPGTNADNLRTSDQYDMYNGSPQRYDWKLVGKKEIYVPYNSYKLHSNTVKYADLLKKNHINQDLARYELHRVWVVDSTLKAGTSHLYSRRTLYVDEDSWQILAVDCYDRRGQLYRVQEGHVINYYEVPNLWTTLELVMDLSNGRYLALGLQNEEPRSYDFTIKRTPADYQPNALQQAWRRARRVAVPLAAAARLRRSAPAQAQDDPAASSLAEPLRRSRHSSLLLDIARAGIASWRSANAATCSSATMRARLAAGAGADAGESADRRLFRRCEARLAVGHDEMILAHRGRRRSLGTRALRAGGAAAPAGCVVRGAAAAIAVGAYGATSRATDGGRVWSQAPFEPTPVAGRGNGRRRGRGRRGIRSRRTNSISIASCAALGPARFYHRAEAGHLFRSDDAGATWRELPSPYEGSFLGLLAARWRRRCSPLACAATCSARMTAARPGARSRPVPTAMLNDAARASMPSTVVDRGHSRACARQPRRRPDLHADAAGRSQGDLGRAACAGDGALIVVGRGRRAPAAAARARRREGIRRRQVRRLARAHDLRPSHADPRALRARHASCSAGSPRRGLRIDANFTKQLPLQHEYMQTYLDHKSRSSAAPTAC